MSPTSSPPESRTTALLGALFILLFFSLFSYGGLFAYFTFDDGTAVVANLLHFETPMWRNVVHVLTVFTKAYRPLATMFWRPMYAVFGYNPLPYRIAIHLMMMINIWLAYVLARRLEVTREAAALATLVFCYNASMSDLYYDSCTVTDVICFLLYALAMVVYVRGRRTGNPLSWWRMAAVGVFYLLALDSKELAVALPGVLLIYELLYRRQDFRDRRKALRIGLLLMAMVVVGAIYLKVKVAEMAPNTAYRPHPTVGFVLTNVGHYLRHLMYLPDNSLTTVQAWLILGGLLAAGALVRSRAAVFGVLFFVVALIPVAVIPARGAYCAYIPYVGLTLAVGAILAGARAYLARLIPRKDVERGTAIVLFLCVAILLGRAHMTHWASANGFWEWDKPRVVDLLTNFRRNIPEFPPNARVLITEDPWGGDWGPMFLVQLMYHDAKVWVDRPKNLDHPPDLSTYDVTVSYKPGYIDLNPARVFGVPLKWLVRGSTSNPGAFVVSSPNAHGAGSHVMFEPQASRERQSVKVTIPGLSSVAVNALYRIVSGKNSTPYLVNNFCTLDASGSCTITAPAMDRLGAMAVDWVQPAGQRWIFTSGVLTVVE
jgi:hypothetical protein